MYLTTHRIESLKPPKQRAIHGYLYEHDGLELTPHNFEEITVRDPGGELKVRHTPEPPKIGGNAVLSYLDIVARDNIRLKELQAQLAVFAREIAGGDLPARSLEGPAWLKFHITTFAYRQEKNAVDEYAELMDVALSLFQEWRQSANQ